MSLSVYLTKSVSDFKIAADYLEESGFDEKIVNKLRDVEGEELYWANITHNLSTMAQEAFIYDCVWRPEENGIKKAKQLIEPLTVGLNLLRQSEEHYKQFDSPNGWGTYKHFVPWLQKYLDACKEHPDADVSVSR